MDSRSTRLWAFAGAFSLAILLALVCHPGFPAGPPAGMSAPAPVKASFESSPAAGLFGSHFDWHPHVLAPSGFAFAAAAAGRSGDAPRPIVRFEAHYGPLHRRPPPSFS
jgi:hypothetical protein